MSVATLVLPVFAVIAIGYLAARFALLSAAGQKGLAEFAFSIAIPTFLFRTIATAAPIPFAPGQLWLAFFGPVMIVWLLATVVTVAVLRRPLVDSASIAMTSTYGNTVMLGIPLCLALYGEAAAAPMAIILAVHSPLYWLVGTLHDQLAKRGTKQAARDQTGTDQTRGVVWTVMLDLARNPLLIAIALGGLWRLTGLGLAPVPDKIFSLLGQAGVPSALTALGASLAGFGIRGQGPTLGSVIVLKLLVLPAIAALAAIALALPPVAFGVVVIFAAMPAGANAFLFATKVDRAVNSASGAVALGTLLALGSISGVVAWLAV
jgi:malonate transporter and related proteins